MKSFVCLSVFLFVRPSVCPSCLGGRNLSEKYLIGNKISGYLLQHKYSLHPDYCPWSWSVLYNPFSTDERESSLSLRFAKSLVDYCTSVTVVEPSRNEVHTGSNVNVIKIIIIIIKLNCRFLDKNVLKKLFALFFYLNFALHQWKKKLSQQSIN